MTWRIVNWILWGLLIMLVLLGTFGLIGKHFAWIAFVVASLVELIGLLQGASEEGTAERPLVLTGEMVRTQNRGYDRAVARLRSGGSVRYQADTDADDLENPAGDGITVEIQDELVLCKALPERPLKQDAWIAREELERIGTRFDSLRRAAPDIDALCRGKPTRLVLLDPGQPSRQFLCTLEDGQFRWSGRSAGRAEREES